MKIISLVSTLALSGLLLVTAKAGPIPPGPSAAYVHNSAGVSNEVFNVANGEVRGTLTVGTLSTPAIAVTTVSATSITGSGAGITALNASNLSAGTVPAAVVWNGATIATQYGCWPSPFTTMRANIGKVTP